MTPEVYMPQDIGVESQLCHSPAVRPWVSDSTFPSFSIFTSELGTQMAFIPVQRVE